MQEQALFVVGLNQGKFFGPDSAEEGLKLVEGIAEHNQGYHLLFGISARDLAAFEDEHPTKRDRLTPSRDLQSARQGELVPLIQASMLDKQPRKAVGRLLKTIQGHVAWRLWKNPKEAMGLYRWIWKRSQYRDAAAFKFWSEKLPLAAHVYYGESAELITIRTVEHLVAQRLQGRGGTSVLIVGNDLYSLVIGRLHYYLDDERLDRLIEPEFSQDLQDRASDLCRDVPDMTPILVFMYIGVPLLVMHQLMLFLEYLYTRKGLLGRQAGEFDDVDRD